MNRMQFIAVIGGIVTIALCAGLFFLLIFFMADKVPVTIVMANHTDDDLIVEVNNSRFNVASGGVIDLPWFKTTNAKIRIQKPSGINWDFQWKFPIPQNYSIHQRVYIQVERDAELYVLPFKIDSSVKDLPPQPPEYPLHAAISEKRKVQP